MGGNLFTARRYKAEEYKDLEFEVKIKLNELFGVRVFPLLYYKNKESFGDMDILLESDNLPPNWKNVVKSEFNLTDELCHSNGNVFSFMYKNFQIDLICMQKKYFKSAYAYYAYNDLGNLLGRLTHKMGIKLGHKGLSLIVRPSNFNDHIIGEVELSQDIDIALDILGLDKEVYKNGFDDVEDIFKYVASSPYFNPDIYLLENRNATSRVRDNKRQTYTKFLEWCEANKDSLNRFDFGTVQEMGGYSIREPWYTDVVLKFFPEAEEQVNSLIYEFEINQKLAERLSGGIVMKVTGVEGKELGILYKKIKEILLNKYTKEQLIEMNPHTVERMISAVKFSIDNGFTYPYVPVAFAINMIRGDKPTIYG